MNHLTDEELVATYVHTQQSEHFALLYKRYYKKVYAQCLSFEGAGIQAEDLTHDVFERVLHKLDTFRGTARFSTWLFAVCRNYCLTQHHREQQRHQATSIFGETDERIVLPSVSTALDQQLTRLEVALQDLPDDDKRLITARYEMDASIDQLRLITQASPSATKMRLWRARERLRRALRQPINSSVLLQKRL